MAFSAIFCADPFLLSIAQDAHRKSPQHATGARARWGYNGRMLSEQQILFALLVAVIIGLAIWIALLERRIAKLLGGKSGASLEDAIMGAHRAIDALHTFQKDTTTELGRLDGRIKKKLHGVRTLRFNPFAGTGTGGNQSFAAAFLDEEGDGVVLSSLYSRDKVSVFAKPVKAKRSEFELTGEERAVLEGDDR